MNAIHMSSMSRPKSILVATDLNDLDFLLPVAIDQAQDDRSDDLATPRHSSRGLRFYRIRSLSLR